MTGLGRDDPVPATRALAGALTRAATEPSAVEQTERRRRTPSPTLLARQRLEREIDSRNRLLASTEAQLADLGRLGRRRHGQELREVIEVQRRVLGDLQTELAEIRAPDTGPRPPRERSAALRTHERTPTRPVERGIGLEL